MNQPAVNCEVSRQFLPQLKKDVVSPEQQDHRINLRQMKIRMKVYPTP